MRLSEPVGIASLGLKIPSFFLDLKDFAHLRNTDPNKYEIGLGCREMALCLDQHTVVDLALGAARRALMRRKGGLDQIGFLAIGTESGLDMSAPLTKWVARELRLSGALRSYEVKHACLGGTLALRQAYEWRCSPASKGKAALVIAVDDTLYEARSPGEPTQGAGAVAMIVDEPLIAEMDPCSHSWSRPADDFWRPVGEPYPHVDGPLSLECYNQGALACFQAYCEDTNQTLGNFLENIKGMSFHTPFPKMVQKALGVLCEKAEITAGNPNKAKELFLEKVAPHLTWNQKIGNSMTASLWFSVAQNLCGRRIGEQISAFSYGSGCGAELQLLTAGPEAQAAAWAQDLQEDFSQRTRLSAQDYDSFRTRNQAVKSGFPAAELLQNKRGFRHAS
ncbi:MAG: hydroxymethylglutaryl-CoA synthase family protein [Alphaproteobacteria bacterium]|nr:hydroxymethylglutaryl-CoA synthase family protein [Alphaproteobacteria bacterium]NCQ66365.1 hydroxymethylglutaryl-CoA synthase family protein [Alphaproteobacteria bacterium]NCT06851.1 hydroxymethylglutaryl-CoA synthase family protein [Alphaproteobacteria bacterium]